MKNTVKYLLLASILLTYCTQEPAETQNDPELSAIPVFIDDETIPEDPVIEEWLSFVDHYPMYFGKLKDTIFLSHDKGPVWVEDYPQGKYEKMFSAKRGQFDDYYLDWLSRRDFKSADSVKLDIQVDTNQIISNNGRRAYPVIIQNLHTDTVYVGYDDRIYILTEALDENGIWKPIQRRFINLCGNGISYIILPPKHFVITSDLVYSGGFKTKLRVRCGKNVSNEFSGSINKSQFESEWDNNGVRKKIPRKD